MTSIFAPKIPKIPPPPQATSLADRPNTNPRAEQIGYASYISTGSSGLTKKATTAKKSLLGG